MIRKILQIELFHTWFKHGKFELCQVIPDANTQQLITHYRLMTQMRDAKFELYSVMHENTEALLTALDSFLNGQAMRFLLIYKPSQFSFITDLALDFLGKITFNSRHVERDAQTGKVNCKPVPQAGLSITAIPIPPQNAKFEEDVIAEIAIYPSDLLSSAQKPIEYTIHFNTRVSHWFYYLINRSHKKLFSPFISNGDGIFFNEPETVVMPNGQTALGFSSGNLQFPMQQAPTSFFSLFDRLSPLIQTRSQSIDHCLIKGLPTPKPGQLIIKQFGNNAFVFNEMYIYL